MPLPRTNSKNSKKAAAKRKAEPLPEQELDQSKKQKLGAVPSPSRTPSTRPKVARDLSQIFDDATASLSSKNPPNSPNKVAKRMLGRSRTESSITNESESSNANKIADRTSSLPSIPSPSRHARSHSPPPSFEKPAPEAPPTPKRAPSLKKTYAGKSRTFLVALPVNHSVTSLEQSMQEEEDEYMNRESYDSLRNRWGVDNSDDGPFGLATESAVSSVDTTPTKGREKGMRGKTGADKPPPPLDEMKPFQSITEIRNKGESRRFLDEVGYLLEGMDKDETPASRRSSALEITNRLCEMEFARKAKAADFLLRTWEAFVEGGAGLGQDKVLDVLFAFFCALVARDSGSLSDLIERARMPTGSSAHSTAYSPFISILFQLLAITELKRLRVMKSDRIMLKSLYETIASRSQVLPAAQNISTLALITFTLSTVQPLALSPAHHLEPLLTSLHAQLSPLAVHSDSGLEGPNNDVSVGQSSTQDHSSPTLFYGVHFEVLQDLLGLFDSYLLKRWAAGSEEGSDIIDRAREDWLAKGLIGLGIRAEVACAHARAQLDERFATADESEPFVDLASASKCIDLALRILLSLTHSDSDWSSTIVHDPIAVTFIIGEICRVDDVRWRSWNNTQNATRGTRSSRKGKTPVKEEPEDWIMESDLPSDDGDGDVKGLLKSRNGTGNERSQAQALDRLCLALGLLMNIVQEVRVAKDILREAEFDPGCIHKLQPCMFSCICPNATSVLNVLAGVYQHQLIPAQAVTSSFPNLKRESSPPSRNGYMDQSLPPKADVEKAEAEADASFLLGHLSVLFGLLMIGNLANQVAIMEALPAEASDSGSNRKLSRHMKLDRMVDNAKTLAAFYEKVTQVVEVDRDGSGSEHGDLPPGDSRMDNRLEDISGGVNVARKVVSFLEGLRDDQ
ncbi:hypothetical protein AAF712_014535 [Marasmius tenuissimus]|uniref:Wings apart-like protein C-terminal domain-containing protein n=1 Tax=Marasmius tenuissimus TaxID=585030 RepID=A0ABR2ZBT8_9AGAR